MIYDDNFVSKPLDVFKYSVPFIPFALSTDNACLNAVNVDCTRSNMSDWDFINTLNASGSSSSSRTSTNVVSNSGDDLQSDIKLHKTDTSVENLKIARYVPPKPKTEIKAPSSSSFQIHNKRGVKHDFVMKQQDHHRAKQLVKHQTCFHCGVPGHIARNCKHNSYASFARNNRKAKLQNVKQSKSMKIHAGVAHQPLS
ncbi:hypothetical protein E3N88_32968 [Mikania micrantha]|uniref:CCHC-type domain-containing protein n=1 Tax=Mikania micrantha TaxID=192012 RepID=A0A5N6MCK9_9ASTR|nr:hypothetical protein E3N88_32968 [Mikania micrantha]